MADEIVAVYRAEVEQYKKAVDELVGRVNTLDKEQKKAGDTATKMGERFKGLGREIITAFGVTAGIAGFVSVMRGAFNAAKDFEAQMSKVRAVSGATAAEMDKLEASAKSLGASTMFTATQVGQLQEEYAKLGFTTREILAATAATLDLAAATGSTLAQAAEVAGSTIQGFGLDASDTTRVTDVMAQSFNRSALDIERFRESIKLVAPIARAANIDLETTTALLGQLANAGLSGSIAGTALKNLISKLSDENSDLSKQLGFAVKNSDDLFLAFDKLAKMNIDLTEATELTDERSKAAFITLFNGIGTVKELDAAFRDATGTNREMAEIMQNNLAGSITKMTSAWEGFTNEILGNQGAIKSVVDLLTNAISGWQTIFQRLGGVSAEQAEAIKMSFYLIEGATASARRELEKYVKPLMDAGDATGAQAKANELAAIATSKLALRQKQQSEATDALNKKQAQHKALFMSLNPINNARAIAMEDELEQLKLRKISADTEVESIEAVIGVYERYIRQLNEAGSEGGAIESNVRSIARLNKELKTLKEEFENAEIGSKKYYDTIGKIEAKTKELELIEYEILLLTDLQAANEKARQQQDKYSKSFEETMNMRMDAINAFYDEQQIGAIQSINDEEERARKLIQIEDDRLREQLKLLQGFGKSAIAERKKLAENEAKTWDDVNGLYLRFLQGQSDDYAKFQEKEANDLQKRKDAWQLTDEQILEAAGQFAQSFGRIIETVYANELAVLDASLESGQISREQYDEERKKLLRRQAADQKALALLTAVINTAAAVVAQLSVPVGGFALAAIAGVLGAIEIATIAATPLPQFATGVIGLQGGGTETSDSILARLSKGESVMTAAETKKYRPLLEGMRNGTLDDIIRENYVRPAIDAALLNGFGDMGTSAMLQDRFNDMNLLRAIDRHRESEVGELRQMNVLLGHLVRQPKRGYA
jgi:TP901 family phage tail tape measure protein